MMMIENENLTSINFVSLAFTNEKNDWYASDSISTFMLQSVVCIVGLQSAQKNPGLLWVLSAVIS